MRPLTPCVLIGLMVLLGGAPACDDSSASNDASAGSLECRELDQVSCAKASHCTWTTAGCTAVDAGPPSDAGDSGDGGPCSPVACAPPLCGWVNAGGADICIVKPDCTGLSQGECSATLGCRTISGRRPTDPPNAPASYVGCGDGTGNPGTAITCTASGPNADCWILPSTAAPSGWEKWSCGADPKTRAECMAQGPYASDGGPADAS